jgi:predicted kinase
MRFSRYITEQKEKEIVIAVGLPASGKSTYIKRNYKNHIVVSNDIIVDKYAVQNKIDYNEAFERIGKSKIIQLGMKDFKKALKTGKNIILDNTNLTKSIRKQYLDLSEGYKKIALIFKIGKKEMQKRLKGREGKTIPDEVIEKMERSYEEPTKLEGFDEMIKI